MPNIKVNLHHKVAESSRLSKNMMDENKLKTSFLIIFNYSLILIILLRLLKTSGKLYQMIKLLERSKEILIHGKVF